MRISRILPRLFGALLLGSFWLSAHAQWRVGLEGTAALPVGQYTEDIPFGDALDLGYGLDLSARYVFNPKYSLLLQGGYLQFPVQQDTRYYLRAIPLQVGLEYSFLKESEKLRPFVALAGGVHITESNIAGSQSRSFAHATGMLGARYRLRENLHLQLTGRYVRLFSRSSSPGLLDLQYVPVSVGVTWMFVRPEF